MYDLEIFFSTYTGRPLFEFQYYYFLFLEYLIYLYGYRRHGLKKD